MGCKDCPVCIVRAALCVQCSKLRVHSVFGHPSRIDDVPIKLTQFCYIAECLA